MTPPTPAIPTAAPGAPEPADRLRAACHGEPPLSARLEPWMRELLADPDACARLLDAHGSPVNVHDLSPLERNAQELHEVARRHGIDLRIFVARKANKSLALVDAARRGGHGVDVGSERELAQALERGTPPTDIVLTAAVKPHRLLELALSAGAVVVLDNLDEAQAALRIAEAMGGPPRSVALRIAPAPGGAIVPTRFGEPATVWEEWARGRAADGGLRVLGVHFHLHGYAAPARVAALAEALHLVDVLRSGGHAPAFIDIGGGIPMSYLDDEASWLGFWTEHGRALRGERDAVTWRGDGLGLRRLDPGATPPEDRPAGQDDGDADRSAAAPRPRDLWSDVRTALGPRLTGTPAVYPYHQSPVRGPWLEAVLSAEAPGGVTVARALRDRSLELRCEPGRAMLDGCGMTLARIVHRTRTSDGTDLVALAMNRTQCRSTSADFLVDPILVRPSDAGAPSAPFSGFLVGAYCIEDELILRRRMRFPDGAAVGDIVALPNTAGYLMHILESASHQIPLAATVHRAGDGGFVRDDIDG